MLGAGPLPGDTLKSQSKWEQPGGMANRGSTATMTTTTATTTMPLSGSVAGSLDGATQPSTGMRTLSRPIDEESEESSIAMTRTATRGRPRSGAGQGQRGPYGNASGMVPYNPQMAAAYTQQQQYYAQAYAAGWDPAQWQAQQQAQMQMQMHAQAQAYPNWAVAAPWQTAGWPAPAPTGSMFGWSFSTSTIAGADATTSPTEASTSPGQDPSAPE